MPKNDDKRVNAALRKYVTDPGLAIGYDRYYEDVALLDFDTQFLDEALPREGLVLDIGCGTGRHIITLASAERRFVGMDLSRHMLDVTRAKLDRANLTAPLVMADMRAPLPFRDGSLDAVICMFSTIGLIPSAAGRLAFVREAARVLRPGGILAFHVHNRLNNVFTAWGRLWLLRTYIWDRLFSDLELGDRVMPSYRGVKNMFLHVFSPGEVRRLVSDGGFEMVHMALLNRKRTGETSGPLCQWRANGLIVSAAKR